MVRTNFEKRDSRRQCGGSTFLVASLVLVPPVVNRLNGFAISSRELKHWLDE